LLSPPAPVPPPSGPPGTLLAHTGPSANRPHTTISSWSSCRMTTPRASRPNALGPNWPTPRTPSNASRAPSRLSARKASVSIPRCHKNVRREFEANI
jgi:hypothetical protein